MFKKGSSLLPLRVLASRRKQASYGGTVLAYCFLFCLCFYLFFFNKGPFCFFAFVFAFFFRFLKGLWPPPATRFFPKGEEAPLEAVPSRGADSPLFYKVKTRRGRRGKRLSSSSSPSPKGKEEVAKPRACFATAGCGAERLRGFALPSLLQKMLYF